MLVKGVYEVGRVLGAVILAVTLLIGFGLPNFLLTPGPLAWQAIWPLALLFIGMPAIVVVHEAGHAWACLVLGVEIRAVRLGRETPRRPRFTAGKFTVSLPIADGAVMHGDARSAGRGALLTAAGSLANLIVAATLAGAVVAAHSANGDVLGFACLMAGVGPPEASRRQARHGPRDASPRPQGPRPAARGTPGRSHRPGPSADLVPEAVAATQFQPS